MKKKKQQQQQREKGTGAIKARKIQSSGKVILYFRPPGSDKFQSSNLEDTEFNRKVVNDMLDKLADSNKDINPLLIKSKIGIHTKFEEFLEEKIKEGISEATKKNYISGFYFIIPTNFDLHDKTILNDKVVYRIEIEVRKSMAVSGFAASTKNLRLRNLQTFLTWLNIEGYLPIELKMFRKYKMKAKLKEVMPYSEAEMTAIFKKVLFNKRHNLELACWILFCRYSGSRIKESLSLTWDDVNYENRLIKFKNKIDNTKVDYFPLSVKMMRILNVLKYLSEKRENNKHKLFRWEPPSKNNLNKWLSDIEIELGIKKKGRGAHGIRKLFSQELFDWNDGDLDKSKIAELMRHKSSSTTDKHYRQFKAKQLLKTLEHANL